MTTAAPTAYELRVAGHLDDHWSDALGRLAIVRNADGTTTLRGPVVDQAQLHGVLATLRDIGAVLMSLEAATDDPAVEPVLRRILRTERLVLRPASPEDAGATWSYRRLESVSRWITSAASDFMTYAEAFTEPERLATTVVVELAGETGAQIVGDFMLSRQDAWAQSEVKERARNTQAELGWVLDPAHTGNGYATEAVRELLRYCFEDLGVRRVVANCFADNDESWRLMERVGMRRELHAVRESLHRSGEWLDGYGYAILAEEWRS